jgi:hypothetical protein
MVMPTKTAAKTLLALAATAVAAAMYPATAHPDPTSTDTQTPLTAEPPTNPYTAEQSSKDYIIGTQVCAILQNNPTDAGANMVATLLLSKYNSPHEAAEAGYYATTYLCPESAKVIDKADDDMNKVVRY